MVTLMTSCNPYMHIGEATWNNLTELQDKGKEVINIDWEGLNEMYKGN